MRLKLNKRALLLAFTAATALLSGNTAQADQLSTKGDSFLAGHAGSRNQTGWTNVIVRFAGEPTRDQRAQLARIGASIYRRLPIIQSAALAVPTRNLEKLAALPFVQRLSADADVKKNDEFIVQHTGADTAFAASNLTGYGVTVAVIDTGILSLPDLNDDPFSCNSRIIGAVSYVPPTGSQSANTYDQCGHGTHVAGIIAGNGIESTGCDYFRTFYGIARRSNLVNVRVLDNLGQGTVSQVVSGIQWCITNKAKYKIRVMNLSLGHPVGESYKTDPLCQAVESAWKAGITVVCAAGNEGRLNPGTTTGANNEGYGTNYGSIQSPGNDPYVITVGATKNMDGNRADDKITTYSSRGPTRLDLVLKPDLIAPGNKVISLYALTSLLGTQYSYTNAVSSTAFSTSSLSGVGKYYVLSGTSMAAPVVAGAAALMLQKYPTLTPDTIKARLMLSADKWAQPDGTADPCTFGAGYLNIPAALLSAAVPNQAATSPSMSIDSTGNVYVNLDRALWGTDVKGNRAVWGVTAVYDLRAVWGTRAIWGTSTNILNASRAIWGQSVWADRAVWGTTSSAVDLTSTAISGE